MIPRELFQKIRRLEIRTKGLVENVFGGEYHSAFKGRGIEFTEVRPYQFGDDIRNSTGTSPPGWMGRTSRPAEEERSLALTEPICFWDRPLGSRRAY